MEKYENIKIMSIEQLFLNYKGCGLYTSVLKPAVVEKWEGYVIVHPFAEEKKSAHRILFEIADSISEQGYYVLMFDFSGCGDSEGSLLTSTLDDWFGEIKYVADWFKVNYKLNNVHFIGLRLGAFMVNIFHNQSNIQRKLILLEPVINPETYFKNILKSKLFKELVTSGSITSNRNELIEDLKENKTLDFDGHEIGAAFYRSIVKYRDDFYLKETDKTNVINISITGKISKEYLRMVEAGLLERAHLFTITMEPFWDRIESSPEISELNKLIISCL
jgi:alpha/beta superfamily hydrolase